MDFKDRLNEFRVQKNYKKRQIANLLSISESYYNLLESGKRKPSKKILYELVLLSNKPEEFWVYGIIDSKKIIDINIDFKCTKSAFEYWNNINELNLDIINTLFNACEENCSAIEKTFIKAIKADLYNLYKSSIEKL